LPASGKGSSAPGSEAKGLSINLRFLMLDPLIRQMAGLQTHDNQWMRVRVEVLANLISGTALLESYDVTGCVDSSKCIGFVRATAYGPCLGPKLLQMCGARFVLSFLHMHRTRVGWAHTHTHPRAPFGPETPPDASGSNPFVFHHTDITGCLESSQTPLMAPFPHTRSTTIIVSRPPTLARRCHVVCFGPCLGCGSWAGATKSSLGPDSLLKRKYKR
jgi:hypothetical protein